MIRVFLVHGETLEKIFIDGDGIDLKGKGRGLETALNHIESSGYRIISVVAQSCRCHEVIVQEEHRGSGASRVGEAMCDD